MKEIPHDVLDNRRANLRPCTNVQNSYNQAGHPDSSSGFKGVHWARRESKWRAQIRTLGRQRDLGYFTDELEAAHAYDAAALELHGEFARLNFPLGGIHEG